MKNFFLILISLFILLFSCSDKQKMNEDETLEKIKVIKLGKGRGIIFPASYGEKLGMNSDKIKGFFTPNENTIKYIHNNLASNFDSLPTNYQKELKSFSILKKDLDKYDKQFLGCINHKKDSIVYCVLVNFESDPFNWKERFEREFLGCADGWCNTNVLEFDFYISSKQFKNLEP